MQESPPISLLLLTQDQHTLELSDPAVIALSERFAAIAANPDFNPLASVPVPGITLASLEQLIADAKAFIINAATFRVDLVAGGTGARIGQLLTSAAYLGFTVLRQLAAELLASTLHGLTLADMRICLKWPGDRFLAEERESRLKENGLRLEDDNDAS